ncbi:hypothetical protein KKF82_08965 [Patescibacteria group bacterium]|nr:hypothetical protein [Patescibacteria group bacterium]
MSTLNYILPTGSMTLTDQREYRQMAIAAGIERAADKNIGNISDDVPGVAGVANRDARVNSILKYLLSGNVPPSIDIREMQVLVDIPAIVLDQWNTAVLAVVGTAYSVFQAVAAPVMAANRLAVFYKVGVEAVAPMPVSRLTFRSGGALGNIIGLFDLEQLVNRLETDGYFSEPVIIDPTATYAVQVTCRVATGAIARVQLGCFVFEPAGTVIA